MEAMRILMLLVVLLASRPSDACGFWSMTDKERKTEVGFHINSASITNGKKRLGAFYLDIEAKDGMRVVKGRTVVYDIKGDKLRKRGKVVATISGDTIAFGKKQYAIELTDPHMEHEVMPAWKLAVRRDGELIVEAEHASSLCAGMKRDMTPAQHEDEVRRRVIYYLAWRELGG
jgi:hypothetical protein